MFKGTGRQPQAKKAASNIHLSGHEDPKKYRFKGRLDEVRIFSRELTAQEIQKVMQEGISSDE